MTVPQVLSDWNKVSGRIRQSIRGLKERDLDRRGGTEGWSIRETVHHLVEANLIASNMIIAALAIDDYDYDWTWVNPSSAWMQRAGYDIASVEPAIRTLSALCRHISELVASRPEALARTIRLNDAPGQKRYVMSVEQILQQQIEHATDHLAQIRQLRKTHS